MTETNFPAARPIRPGDHLYLIDGSGFIFRAYHALPPLTRKSDGLPTGAVSGFCNMLWKLLEDTKAGDKPSHLAVIFDAGRKTFRNDMFEEYKANRSEPPDDLIPQFPLTRDAVRAFGVACVEKQGYEADDLIATMARQLCEQDYEIFLVSKDKDLRQILRADLASSTGAVRERSEADAIAHVRDATPGGRSRSSRRPRACTRTASGWCTTTPATQPVRRCSRQPSG